MRAVERRAAQPVSHRGVFPACCESPLARACLQPRRRHARESADASVRRPGEVARANEAFLRRGIACPTHANGTHARHRVGETVQARRPHHPLTAAGSVIVTETLRSIVCIGESLYVGAQWLVRGRAESNVRAIPQFAPAANGIGRLTRWSGDAAEEEGNFFCICFILVRRPTAKRLHERHLRVTVQSGRRGRPPAEVLESVRRPADSVGEQRGVIALSILSPRAFARTRSFSTTRTAPTQRMHLPLALRRNALPRAGVCEIVSADLPLRRGCITTALPSVSPALRVVSVGRPVTSRYRVSPPRNQGQLSCKS